MSSRTHLWLVAILLSWVQSAGATEARAVDAQIRVSIEGTITLAQGESGKIDAIGLISIPAPAVEARATANVRVPGHTHVELMLGGPLPIVEISFKQIKSRAAYLSIQGASNRSSCDATVAPQGQMVVNALVIDMKGDRGDIPYPGVARVTAGVVPGQKDRVARINQFTAVIR